MLLELLNNLQCFWILCRLVFFLFVLICFGITLFGYREKSPTNSSTTDFNANFLFVGGEEECVDVVNFGSQYVVERNLLATIKNSGWIL